VRGSRTGLSPDLRWQGLEACCCHGRLFAPIRLLADGFRHRLTLPVGQRDPSDVLEQDRGGRKRQMGAEQGDTALDARRDLAWPLPEHDVLRTAALAAGPAVVVGAAVADLADQRAKRARGIAQIDLLVAAGPRPLAALVARPALLDLVAQRDARHRAPELDGRLLLGRQAAALLRVLLSHGVHLLRELPHEVYNLVHQGHEGKAPSAIEFVSRSLSPQPVFPLRCLPVIPLTTITSCTPEGR
jgi:hypothetical protein